MGYSKIPRHKVIRNPEFKEVIYDERRWRILRSLREEAKEIMSILLKCGLKPITHGSIARGDVTRDSDIDIVIPYAVQPYLVELCIEKSNLKMYSKYIIRATPIATPKAYIELDVYGKRTISFPLSKLSAREWEFYRFVPGVNKSLVLIIPTEFGHKEAPVIGYEDFVARILNVSIDTVLERVKVLTRRDEHGRTGVFLKYHLRSNESFEEAIDRLIEMGKLDI
ncbi:MAG: DNA polymerase subunit beta [Desulfurococcales archaeon ex4484_42]|nr:MAG: DNA polymerase subunit beta [Desulfurococcales archaeon ex4484_42]